MQITNLDLILILSYIYILNIIFVHFLQIKFESGLPSTISLIVFILYFFGIFSNLILGFYILLVFPFIVFIVGTYLLKNIPIHIRNIFTPGMAIYTTWILTVFYIYGNQILIHHDDLNFWGLTIKNSLAIDSIGNGPGTNSGYNDYPPASSLLAYFFGKIHGGYSEAVSLFAMSIWAYSILASFTENLNWKNYWIILLYAISGYLLPSFFLDTDFHTTLVVDCLLALVFGYGLFLSISIDRDFSLIKIFQLSLVIISIVLLKKMGIFLSFIILIISTINIYRSINYGFFKSFSKNNISILILSVSYLFSVLSWKFFVKFHRLEIVSSHNSFFNLIQKFSSFDLILPERLGSVWSIYWRALWSQSITSGSINLSFISFIFVLLLFLTYFINSMSKKIKINVLIILISMVFFLIGHFSMYGFVLSDGESMSLSSFSRYLLPLTVGLFILIIACLFSRFNSHISRNSIFLLVTLLFLPILSLKISQSSIKTVTTPSVHMSISEKISLSITQLENAISTNHDPFLKQWASNQLNKIKNNQKPDLPPRNLISDLSEIVSLQSQQEVQMKGEQMQVLFASKTQSFDKGKYLCLIEGQEGTSYGHAMGFRYKFAPIVTKRILTYKSTTPSDYERHKLLFYNDLKFCGGAFLISINDNFQLQYKKFFISDLKNYGFYEVIWNSGEPLLKLTDCTICD